MKPLLSAQVEAGASSTHADTSFRAISLRRVIVVSSYFDARPTLLPTGCVTHRPSSSRWDIKFVQSSGHIRHGGAPGAFYGLHPS